MTRGRSDELAARLKRLSHRPHVYARTGALRPTDGAAGLKAAVAAEVHTLVRRLWRDHWHECAESRTTVQQVEGSFMLKDDAQAAVLMADTASRSLLWDMPLMDGAEADDLALRVVELLGSAAIWWSNRDGCTFDTVTGCTMDTFVAGTDGERFVVLIQVGED
ncbi:hypothetical protein ACWCP6_04740 [Streptomyces sp. NPDC002004]